MSVTRILGPGTGPRVLLLPGLGLTGRVYDPVIDRLRRDHEIVTLDRPGLGLAARHPLTVPRLADWVGQIDAALDRADAAAGRPRPAVLVGHSMAGLAAQAYARQVPARVAALLLLDCSVAEPQDAATLAASPAVQSSWHGEGVRGLLAAWACSGGGAPGPRGRARVVVAEMLAYRPMGADLLRRRAARRLTVPTIVLAVTWTTWARRDSRWLAAQEGLARTLRETHADGVAGVGFRRIAAGHLAMRWAPDLVAASVREITRPLGDGTGG